MRLSQGVSRQPRLQGDRRSRRGPSPSSIVLHFGGLSGPLPPKAQFASLLCAHAGQESSAGFSATGALAGTGAFSAVGPLLGAVDTILAPTSLGLAGAAFTTAGHGRSLGVSSPAFVTSATA